MRRRAPLILAVLVALLALLPGSAEAVGVGLVVSLIRQELVRYGLIDASGNPTAGPPEPPAVVVGTGTSGSPQATNAYDSSTVFTDGGSAVAYYQLSLSPANGKVATFRVKYGVHLAAGTGETIDLGDRVTAAAGYVESVSPGATLTLVAVSGGWIASARQGAWLVDEQIPTAVWAVDASDAASLHVTDAVDQWDDQIGSVDLTQTSTKRPAAGTWDGVTVPSFDGSNDLLVATVANFRSADTSGEVWIVMEVAAVHPSSGRWFFASCDEASAAAYIWSLEMRTSGADYASVGPYVNNNGTPDELVMRSYSAAVSRRLVLRVASNDTRYLFAVNGREDGYLVVSGGSSGAWFGDIPNRDNVTLGAAKYNAEGGQTNCKIAEVRVYSGQMSDAAAAANFDRLMRKWRVAP